MARKPAPPQVTPPSIPIEQSILVLTRQKQAAEALLAKGAFSADEHSAWSVATRGWLEKAYGSQSPNVQSVLDAAATFIVPINAGEPFFLGERQKQVRAAATVLASLIQQLEVERSLTPAPSQPVPAGDDALANVERLCLRFYSVARQIRARHGDRPTLEVDDEYDVQDLLHGLLRIFFDDVRPEEWTPSYAGASARMDFLLKRERLVVETKMARKGLDAKKLGEELLVDIGRYGEHPDCKTLVCFVYDPSGLIRNPAALEGDLSKSSGVLQIRVLIRPRH